MSSIFHALRSDLRRAFGSWAFPGAILGTALLCFFSLYVTGEPVSTVLFAYRYLQMSSVQRLVLILCAIPYATCFCSDWRNNYIRPTVIRATPKGYAVSKCIACACAGGAALLLGKLVYIFILMLKYPMVSNSHSVSPGLGAYDGLLEQRCYFLYIFVNIMVESLRGTFSSLLALCVSTWIPNLFVALFSPLLAYYFIINLFSGILKVPNWLAIQQIFSDRFSFGGAAETFLYQLLFATVLCAAFTVLFAKGVERRLSDG